jgi:hypothetical protein
MKPSLDAILDRLDSWCESQPCVGAIFAFGSRVRGDARSDSDLDLLIDLSAGDDISDTALAAWMREQKEGFPDLRSAFPEFALEIIVLQWSDDPSKDAGLAAVLRGRHQLYQVRDRAVAVWTPPKSPRDIVGC